MLSALRAVFYAAGSVQHFAREFLAAGAHVFSAWAANAIPVAEYAAAQILLANKGFHYAARVSRSPEGRHRALERFWQMPGQLRYAGRYSWCRHGWPVADRSAEAAPAGSVRL